jgi:hypothetical protein
MNQPCFGSDLPGEKEKFELFHENNKFNHYKKATFVKYFKKSYNSRLNCIIQTD